MLTEFNADNKRSATWEEMTQLFTTGPFKEQDNSLIIELSDSDEDDDDEDGEEEEKHRPVSEVEWSEPDIEPEACIPPAPVTALLPPPPPASS